MIISLLEVDSVVARAAVALADHGAPDGQMFHDAVRVANPQLADRLAAPVTTDNGDGLRLARSRASYELRARYRATPFGLFAGVGSVLITESGPVMRPSDPVAHLRPDSEWLNRLIGAYESDPRVLLGVKVALRHPFSIHGDRVYKPARGSVDEGFSRSVRYTPVLRRIIAMLLEGARQVEELYEALDSVGLPQRPGIVEFGGYVGQLIDAGLLVSQLRPASSSTTPLPDVATVLGKRCPGAAEAVLDLHRGMGLVPMTDVVDRVEALRVRGEGLPNGAAPGDALVQVDTVYQKAGSIPAALVRQAVQHACLLDRIALRRGMSTPLHQWHRALVERFGIDRPVPLLVATDPVTGIGLPRWGTAADADQQDHDHDESSHRELCRALLHRAGPSPSTGVAWEVEIRDEDVPGAVDTPHPGRDVCLDVFFEPGGRFLLAPAAVGGSAAPGAFSGRLRSALDAVTGGGATTNLHRLDARPSRVLDFRAPQPRSGNVNRPTDVHGSVLAIDHVPARPTDRVLPDVTVVATHDGVSVCDAAGEPFLTSYSALLNRDSMPGVVRLLAEIADSRGPRWVPWNWGPFAWLPRTPRIVYDGVIVCRAQWGVPDTLRAAVGGPQFAAAVQRWRAERAVPEVVQVSDGSDQLLPLDIATDRLHLAILKKMMMRDGTIQVREDLLSNLTRCWGHADHMELVLSMTSTATATPAVRR